MGQTSSTNLPSNLPSYALHCLRVADNSPASGLLEPFFDYLIAAEPSENPTIPSTTIPEDQEEGLTPVDLGRILESNEGRKVGLKVYNAKSQRIRGESPLYPLRVLFLVSSDGGLTEGRRDDHPEQGVVRSSPVSDGRNTTTRSETFSPRSLSEGM